MWIVIGIVAVVGLLTPERANAQVKLGVIGGINLANVKVDAAGEDETSDSSTGLFAGFTVVRPVTDYVGFEIDGLFLQNGSEDAGTKITINYVAIPVVARFNVRIVEVRVSRGLTNIFKDSGEDFTGKNNSIMFGVGYAFGEP